MSSSIVSKVYFGTHPNSFLALEQSPFNTSSSSGRKNFSSTPTKNFQSGKPKAVNT